MMRNSIAIFLLASLPFTAVANGREIVSATNPQASPGHRDLADCERSLGSPDKLGLRGTLFNRTRGNTSRCEIIHGEPQIVVYVKGEKPGVPDRVR